MTGPTTIWGTGKLGDCGLELELEQKKENRKLK